MDGIVYVAEDALGGASVQILASRLYGCKWHSLGRAR